MKTINEIIDQAEQQDREIRTVYPGYIYSSNQAVIHNLRILMGEQEYASWDCALITGNQSPSIVLQTNGVERFRV